MTEPEFMTVEEFARHEEVAKDAISRLLAFELRISEEDARRKVDVAADEEGVRDYLRVGQPEFWVSIVRTRVQSWTR